MHTYKRIRLITAAFIAAAFLCIAGLSGYAPAAEKTESGKPASVQTNFQRLEGKWVRPDGGYILELRSIKKDGSVAAAYFNPRPIKVFLAEVSRKEGRINLFVELRDINYPGSTYKLQYDPETDRMKGTYFQAVQRQTFDVEFVRVK